MISAVYGGAIAYVSEVAPDEARVVLDRHIKSTVENLGGRLAGEPTVAHWASTGPAALNGFECSANCPTEPHRHVAWRGTIEHERGACRVHPLLREAKAIGEVPDWMAERLGPREPCAICAAN